MPDANETIALVSVVAVIIVFKVVICSCLLRLRRRREEEDTVPIMEEDLVERLQEIHETRRRARRAREAPPSFQEAILHSRPVSYVDVEYLPTYEESLRNSTSSLSSSSCSNSPNKDTYLDFMPSVNPSDILIPMQVAGVTIEESERDIRSTESNA